MAGAKLALAIEVHLRPGSLRCHLAEIDRDDLTAIGQVSHDEPAAPNIARLGQRHRQGKRRGDRGINRVATLAQHLASHIRRVSLLGHDHVLRESLLARDASARSDSRHEDRAAIKNEADRRCCLIKIPYPSCLSSAARRATRSDDGDLPVFVSVELDGNRLAGPGAVANDLREPSRASPPRRACPDLDDRIGAFETNNHVNRDACCSVPSPLPATIAVVGGV